MSSAKNFAHEWTANDIHIFNTNVWLQGKQLNFDKYISDVKMVHL